jgi:hypothetical protein
MPRCNVAACRSCRLISHVPDQLSALVAGVQTVMLARSCEILKQHHGRPTPHRYKLSARQPELSSDLCQNQT